MGNISHHVKVLADVGLLEQVPELARDRRERWWRMVRIGLSWDDADFPWLVIGLPAGAWVDRLPKRPVLIASDLASAALLLSVPLAAWADVLTVAQLLVVSGLILALGPLRGRRDLPERDEPLSPLPAR